MTTKLITNLHTNLACQACTSCREVHFGNDGRSVSGNFWVWVPCRQKQSELFVVIDCFVANLHHKSWSCQSHKSTSSLLSICLISQDSSTSLYGINGFSRNYI